MKHNITITRLIIPLCLAFLLWGCGNTPETRASPAPLTTDRPSAAPSPLAQSAPTTIESIEASWAKLYTDLGSLKQDADVIAVGSIVGVSGVTYDKTIPFTDFTFHCTQVIKDAHQHVKQPTIILHQTGANINGTLTEIQDDPLFKVGEQAILFLHEYSPRHYNIIGGPSGRFVIQDGMVYAINEEGVKLDPPPAIEDFVKQVQK